MTNLIETMDDAALGPAGNVYPKYATRNPIAHKLVGGFLSNFTELVRKSGCRDALEAGCGEGHLSALMASEGLTVRGIDVSPDIVATAKRIQSEGSALRFEQGSVYDLTPARDRTSLVVCCEVLEHLEDPERALKAVASVAAGKVILSAPREPLWRALNMARGRYLSDFGNTPGHLQHWSQRAFVEMVSRHIEIEELRAPIPWTMLLGRPKTS